MLPHTVIQRLLHLQDAAVRRPQDAILECFMIFAAEFGKPVLELAHFRALIGGECQCLWRDSPKKRNTHKCEEKEAPAHHALSLPELEGETISTNVQRRTCTFSKKKKGISLSGEKWPCLRLAKIFFMSEITRIFLARADSQNEKNF